jgi:hypothetical protein
MYFMKSLIVVLVCAGLTGAANAQSTNKVNVGGVYHGGIYAFQPRIAVGVGYYSPLYGPFGYYGYPYGPFYPYASSYNRSSQLQRKEDQIRSDYADRIYSVRQDNSLTGKQKRAEVRDLKKQRKLEIHDLVANYHKQPVNPENLKAQ